MAVLGTTRGSCAETLPIDMIELDVAVKSGLDLKIRIITQRKRDITINMP